MFPPYRARLLSDAWNRQGSASKPSGRVCKVSVSRRFWRSEIPMPWSFEKQKWHGHHPTPPVDTANDTVPTGSWASLVATSLWRCSTSSCHWGAQPTPMLPRKKVCNRYPNRSPRHREQAWQCDVYAIRLCACHKLTYPLTPTLPAAINGEGQPAKENSMGAIPA